MAYHDREWGVPHHDDRALFELLILEGAQAGLSWSTILHKRENYRAAFDSFDPCKIARYDERKVGSLLSDSGIVRNRLKIAATVANAQAFLAVVKEYGTFDRYIWELAGGRGDLSVGGHFAARDLADRLAERGVALLGFWSAYEAALQLAAGEPLHRSSRWRKQPTRWSLTIPVACM